MEQCRTVAPDFRARGRRCLWWFLGCEEAPQQPAGSLCALNMATCHQSCLLSVRRLGEMLLRQLQHEAAPDEISAMPCRLTPALASI